MNTPPQDVSPPAERPTIEALIAAGVDPIKAYQAIQPYWHQGPGSARVIIIPANDVVFAALNAILKLLPAKLGRRSVFVVAEGRSDVVVLPPLSPGAAGLNELVSHMGFFAPTATGVTVASGLGLPLPYTFVVEDVRLGDVVVGTLGVYGAANPAPHFLACPSLALKASMLAQQCGLTVPIGNPEHLVQNIVAAIFGAGIASPVLGQSFQIPDVMTDDLRKKAKTNRPPGAKRAVNDTVLHAGAVRHSGAGVGPPQSGYDAPRAQCDHAGRVAEKLEELRHPSIAIVGIEDYAPPATGDIWRRFASAHAAAVTKALVL